MQDSPQRECWFHPTLPLVLGLYVARSVHSFHIHTSYRSLTHRNHQRIYFDWMCHAGKYVLHGILHVCTEWEYYVLLCSTPTRDYHSAQLFVDTTRPRGFFFQQMRPTYQCSVLQKVQLQVNMDVTVRVMWSFLSSCRSFTLTFKKVDGSETKTDHINRFLHLLCNINQIFSSYSGENETSVFVQLHFPRRL